MMKPPDVLLVSASKKKKENVLTPTVEMLDRLNLRWEKISISSSSGASVRRHRGKKASPFCIIAQSHRDTERWIDQNYPDTPVLLVPCETKNQNGLEALVQAAQKDVGTARPTFAVGKAGAVNAALFATALLALKSRKVRAKLLQFRREQTRKVLAHPIPGE